MNASIVVPIDWLSIEVRIDCDRCGRRFDIYNVDVEGGELRGFYRVGQEGKDWRRGAGRLQERGGPVTGRHRARRVVGLQGEPAVRFECGCSHSRTIGFDDLIRKVADAPEPRISL